MSDIVPSSYLTAAQAIDAVGQHLMPGQWLGQETDLLARDVRAVEEVTAVGEEATAADAYLTRLIRAVNCLLAALSTGDVKAIVADVDGRVRDLPAAFWTRPDMRAVFRSGELPDELRAALEGHKADAGKRWILIAKADLQPLLDSLDARREPAAADGDFRAWLARKIEACAEGKPLPKKRTWMEAQGAFGARLSYRSFDRIWKATVPQSWRRPVRRPPTAPAG